MSNIENTYPRTYRRLTNWWPLPPPQHIADAVAAGVELDADWTAEIEQLRTQEANRSNAVHSLPV